jgi:hypothetical protein
MFEDAVDYVFFAMFSIIAFFFITLFAAGAYELSGIPCEKTATLKGFQYQHSIATGCMLNVNGTWVANSDIVAVDRGDKIVYLPKHKTRTELEFK